MSPKIGCIVMGWCHIMTPFFAPIRLAFRHFGRAGLGLGFDAEARHRRHAGPGLHAAVAAGAGGVVAHVAFQAPWVAKFQGKMAGRG